MQQLDNMDIAGNQISVTIAPLSQAEAAAAAAAAATALDLDDAEGAGSSCGLLWKILLITWLGTFASCSTVPVSRNTVRRYLTHDGGMKVSTEA